MSALHRQFSVEKTIRREVEKGKFEKVREVEDIPGEGAPFLTPMPFN